MSSTAATVESLHPELPTLRPGGNCSLYVHMPWCVRKCPYCDFNSHEARTGIPSAQYVAALLRDLHFELERAAPQTIDTVYFGGGTPSLFPPEQVAAVIEGIRGAVAVTPDAEITLEANPGAVDTGRFAGFRAAGVNRVSIGVQSLRDAQLRRLGRVHNAADARAAVEGALAAGFESVNLDLMYGLPGDGPADALADLRDALSLDTPHLSWYQLTLEPATAWAHKPPPGMPGDDSVVRLEQSGFEELEAAGMERYEVSAWSRRNHRCRHNLNYWQFGDYLGIGAGAHGKRKLSGGTGYVRYGKLRNPLSYMNAAGGARAIETSETTSAPQTVMLEFLMNALRLTDAMPVVDFESATGLTLAPYADKLADAHRQGLLVSCADQIQISRNGMRQLNRILQLFC